MIEAHISEFRKCKPRARRPAWISRPAWANTNGLLNRWNLASALVLNWYDDVQIPVRRIVTRSRAKAPAAFVDAMAALLLQRSLDAPDRARLIDYVAQGKPADAWVPGWFLNRQAPEALSDPGDLAMTTDFRTVLGEVLERRLGNARIEEVFPGFAKPGYLGSARPRNFPRESLGGGCPVREGRQFSLGSRRPVRKDARYALAAVFSHRAAAAQ